MPNAPASTAKSDQWPNDRNPIFFTHESLRLIGVEPSVIS